MIDYYVEVVVVAEWPKALAVMGAYSIAIFLFSAVLGTPNFLTDRFAIYDEVTIILGLGQLPSAANNIVSSDTEYANPMGDTNIESTTQGFLAAILQSIIGATDGLPVIGFIIKLIAIMLAIVSLLFKLLTGNVVVLASGLANESLTDVILGLLLLPMSIATLHAIIAVGGWIISHIPLIGRGDS